MDGTGRIVPEALGGSQWEWRIKGKTLNKSGLDKKCR